MMRTAAVAASLLETAEKRARLRARHRLHQIAAAGAAGVFGLGALVFVSVAILAGLSDPLGLAAAALIVAALWLLVAIGALTAAVLLGRRREPPVLPPGAADQAMAALTEDLGRNSPLLTLAALALGVLAGRR